MAYVTHHVHGSLQTGNTRLDVEIRFLTQLCVDIACYQTYELQVEILHLFVDIGRRLFGLALPSDLKHMRMLVLSHV